MNEYKVCFEGENDQTMKCGDDYVSICLLSL